MDGIMNTLWGTWTFFFWVWGGVHWSFWGVWTPRMCFRKSLDLENGLQILVRCAKTGRKGQGWQRWERGGSTVDKGRTRGTWPLHAWNVDLCHFLSLLSMLEKEYRWEMGSGVCVCVCSVCAHVCHTHIWRLGEDCKCSALLSHCSVHPWDRSTLAISKWFPSCPSHPNWT